MSIRFAIVEDSAEERELYVDYLTRRCRLRCVGAYANGEEALREIPRLRPEMVLMDLRLPGISGTGCAQRLKTALPKVKLVMITGVADLESARESLGSGLDGYATKPFRMNELREAIRLALAGGVPVSRNIADLLTRPRSHSAVSGSPGGRGLTVQERKLMHLLDNGLAYKEIADRLDVRFGTVQQHLHHIYKKLGVHSRTEAVNKYFGRRAH